MIFKEKTCCFFGHRKIDVSDELINRLYEIVEKLIVENKVDVFLFGSKSQFNDLCYTVVASLKREYPHIKRIYIRAEFPYIDDSYKKYLLQRYEETYFPEKIISAGRAVYVERNYEMINKSNFCVIYYNENCGCQKKSGTGIAYGYANSKGSNIINVFSTKEHQ